jgi:hypothetical protein
MAKILLESAIFVESMRLLKCQPIMNHPFLITSNFYLKVQLGLADYQMQKLEGILRWHAVVFLTLNYLQWRRVQVLAQPEPAYQPTLADIIETHRQEHIVEWVKQVAEYAIQTGSVKRVLQRFASPVPD